MLWPHGLGTDNFEMKKTKEKNKIINKNSIVKKFNIYYRIYEMISILFTTNINIDFRKQTIVGIPNWIFWIGLSTLSRFRKARHRRHGPVPGTCQVSTRLGTFYTPGVLLWHTLTYIQYQYYCPISFNMKLFPHIFYAWNYLS